MLSQADLILADRSVTVTGVLDLVEIAKTYQYAMVQHNPTVKRTNLSSLVTCDEVARVLPCPRDSINTHVVVNHQAVTGWDCCNYCLYQIDCHITGYTRQFVLASKVGT